MDLHHTSRYRRGSIENLQLCWVGAVSNSDEKFLNDLKKILKKKEKENQPNTDSF